MGTLCVIQNDPDVPLGGYASFLGEEGVPFHTVRTFAGDPLPAAADLSAVIVLGGAMGVRDTERYPFLVEVKRFIRDAVADGVPLLGICLGGQLLADALGAAVTAGSPYGEKGTLGVTLTAEGIGDPLFDGIDTEFISFQWHNDSFAIPDAAVRLAFSALCPNQAFRWGANSYGLQFHPEVNREIVDLWARWSDETASSADDFLSQFDLRLPAYTAASRRLLINFLRIAGLG